MPPGTLTARQRTLLDRLISASGGRASGRISAVDADRTRLPLSSSQYRIWFFDRIQPDAVIYNVAGAARLRGYIEPELLRRCLTEIVERHEVLRTTYHQVDGAPIQRVHPPGEVTLGFHDLSGLPAAERESAATAFCAEHARRPFDLTRDLMLRPTLVRLSASEHLLLMCLHHIATDGWSLNVLLRELGERYVAQVSGTAADLPALPIQYGDYASWQRSWLDSDEMTRQLEYWRERLHGGKLTDLGTGLPRPTALSWDGGTLRHHIGPEIVAPLAALAEAERATLYMVLVAAQSIVLSRWSGQAEVIIGCPVANRKRAELEHLIGCFINELALAVDTSGNPTFRELLRQVREVALGAYDNQEAPFERVVEAVNPERDAIAHAPLVRHQLGLHNEPRWRVELPQVSFEIAGLSTDTARFDLEVDLTNDDDGGISGTIYYSTDLFTADIVQRLLGSLGTILRQAGTDPDTRIDDLPIVGPAERDRLRQIGDTASGQPERDQAADEPAARSQTVTELIAAAARDRPDAQAVTGPDGTFSHRELDRLASGLSLRLAAAGVQPGQPVAVCLRPSAALVAALLGVLKAGGAAVPVNPGYPVTELNDVLLDCAAGLVITDGQEPAGLDPLVRRLNICDDQASQSHPGDRQATLPAPDDPAVICYQAPGESGPLGMVNSHAGLAHRLAWASRTFPLGPGEAAISVITAFDLAPADLLGPLAAGGRLVIPAQADPRVLAGLIKNEEAGLLRCPASCLAQVLGALAAGAGGTVRLRHVLTSGERPWPALTQRLADIAPQARLYQQAGPAAAALDIVVQPADPSHRAGTYSLLRDPLPGPVLRILDERGGLVPIGPPGELCVAGAPLPAGLLRRPRESAALLVADPLGDTVLFRTGQRARWLPDGGLDLLTSQTRARGHLMERSEVASYLESLPQVARAALGTVGSCAGEQAADAELVAYLTLRDEPESASTPGQARAQFGEIWTGRGAEEDPTLNPEGWNSPHTGEFLTAAEMREWADSAFRRILALRPAHVLEIGCKTGALLFRLAPRSETYTATDLSARALAHITAHQDWLATKVADVTLLRVSADDFDTFRPGQFDTVILNSVVQYFPSVSYLDEVLRQAAAVLVPGGHIYLGAVRSLPLLPALHLPAQLGRLDPGASAAQLARLVAERVERDEELAIDPAYFTALTGRIPGLAEVYLLPCLGRSRNELTGYRYDVVIRTGEPAEPVRQASADWQRDALSLDRIAQLLAAGLQESLLLRNVPDARLHGRLAVLRSLEQHALNSAADAAAALAPQASSPGGPVDPAQLAAVAAEAGYRALVQYADGSPGDELDVLITASTADSSAWISADVAYPAGTGRVLANGGEPAGLLANRPLRAVRARTAAPVLRGNLQEHFPGYAVPAHLMIIEDFPVGLDGTADLTALPRPDLAAAAAEAAREPSSDTERALAKIWAEALGVDRVGVHDDFFALGGHSLLGAELIERVRTEFEVDVPLGRLFESPTIATVAAYLDEQLARPREEIVPIRRHDRDALRERRAGRVAAREPTAASRAAASREALLRRTSQ